MKLKEIVDYYRKNRGGAPGTPVEQFKNPPLLWANLLHIYDAAEKPVEVIDGRELTQALLEKYGEYEEFKEEYCGGDYTHHNFLKPPAESDAGQQAGRKY